MLWLFGCDGCDVTWYQ